MSKFEITYTEGKFFLQEEDASGPFESCIHRWDIFNEFDTVHNWSLQYKENSRQRKYRWSSAQTKTIGALIDLIRVKFESGNVECVARTPDVEVFFYNDK